MVPCRLLAAAAFVVATLVGHAARAEPVDPVVIGWWSYFDPEGGQYQIPTVSNPAHQISAYGDPDTYYYEPSGGHGLLEDPNVLPPQQAWKSIIDYILAKTSTATLSPTFSRDESSDLQSLTEAYFGWAFLLLYVPKDKYCDGYRIHIGTVDDGVQAMANAKILGYANLGENNKYINMVELNTTTLVLRPGINELVLIHEDQAAVERYVRDVWVDHLTSPVPLAPKNVVVGRVTDAGTGSPLYQATVTLGGAVNDSLVTGPLGFYFFAGLPDGAYTLSADAGGYQTGTGAANVALGQAQTEVVFADLALTPGCTCPDGTGCGPSGGCLPECVHSGELGQTCLGDGEVCVNGLCIGDPCDTMTCIPGYFCQDGQCVEITCGNICCQVGETCSAGLCVPDNCAAGCPAGQSCAGGNCVPSCDLIQCVAGLVCKDGGCIEKCVFDPQSCQPDGGVFIDGGLGTGGSGASTGSGGTSSGAASGTGFGPSRGDATPDEGGGCGCATPARGTSGALGLLVALGLLSRRRGRRGGWLQI